MSAAETLRLNPEAVPRDWFSQESIRRADEQLDPELQPYLENTDGRPGWPMLRHPLVYQVPHVPALAWQANDRLKAKREALGRAMAAGDIRTWVFLHERPYRCEALLNIATMAANTPGMGAIDPARLWALAGEVWIDSESVPDDMRIWRAIWTGRIRTMPLASVRACMRSDELREFEALPDRIRVWHGEEVAGVIGMSWTTSRDVADWFARRCQKLGTGTGRLHSGWADKSKALAYFTRRGEYEVLIDPAHVQRSSRI